MTDRAPGLRQTLAVFVHAPAPLVVDGLLTVPIHIRKLRGRVALDVQTRRGYVDALMIYEVGPSSGCALFDLRQSIDQAWLDGRSIPTGRLRAREVGEGPYATMRVVDVPQTARSTHTLRLRYRLGQPHSDRGGAYPPVLAAQGDRRMRWSFGMGDLFDGRHLEMWFPSNLPFDQFPFELSITLTGAPAKHTLITNGAVTTSGPHRWQITFPAWFSSVSQMVELRPTDDLDNARTRVVLATSGRRVLVDVWKPKGHNESLAQEALRIGRMLEANEAIFGPFLAARYTCFFHDADGGMEYAGATTTSSGALEHEVLHSWFARGVMPASDADGWWDEAFTTYVTSGVAPTPLDFDRPPIELCSRRPFQRHTDPAAYLEGSRLFSGMAEMTGDSCLRRSMGKLFQSYARKCLSTAELEEHLVLDTGAVRIVDAFHRFVYGFDDAPGRSGVRFVRLWTSDGCDGRSWINAEVSNDHDAGVCRHFLLLFSARIFGEYQTRSHAAAYVAAIAGFDLRPGEIRTLRVQTHSMRPEEGDADIDLVGAVHVRQSHPSGQTVDHRAGAMMRYRWPAGSRRV